MASGFSYKGVDIYTITDNKGSTVPGYNFNGTSTDNTGTRPLPFALTYNSIQLSNYCTASGNSIFSESGNVDIPPGCKSIAFYGRGGGGGGGGNGGNANVKLTTGPSSNRSGGAGAAGVTAGYVYGYQISVVGQTSIPYTIGTGGAKGDNGANAQNTTGAGPAFKSNASGGDGTAGGVGNTTRVTIGSTNYATNQAPGGNAGTGANVNYNGVGFRDENNGNPGNTPPPNPQPNANFNTSVTYPALNSYGNGGAGGDPVDGGDGAGGALQIFWLYD